MRHYAVTTADRKLGGDPGQLLDADACGRPCTVMTADGKTALLEYQGVRVIKRSRRVWDGAKEALGTTREEYDGLRRRPT